MEVCAADAVVGVGVGAGVGKNGKQQDAQVGQRESWRHCVRLQPRQKAGLSIASQTIFMVCIDAHIVAMCTCVSQDEDDDFYAFQSDGAIGWSSDFGWALVPGILVKPTPLLSLVSFPPSPHTSPHQMSAAIGRELSWVRQCGLTCLPFR